LRADAGGGFPQALQREDLQESDEFRGSGAYCRALRQNQNWLLVESAPVMPDVWGWTGKRGFAFRRIIDIRLGLTLRHFGVTEFATTNKKGFRGLGF
jgi:uncharacterized protein